MTELAARLQKDLLIGTKPIKIRLALAPMSFLTHVALRQLIAEFGGCGLYFSEMCSAKAVVAENPAVSTYFKWQAHEAATLVFQILGKDPLVMANAARRIESNGFFGVDLNFSCAAGVICKTGAGAAILRDPQLGLEIVRQVRAAVKMPLWVKFRLTDKDKAGDAANFAKALESEGVDAITFHPRVNTDRRGRRPYWDAIGTVKQAVKIPVFGNGNIWDTHTAAKVLDTTGCDGLSLGRMSVARPWIFAEMLGEYTPTADSYHYVALKMATLIEQHFGSMHGGKAHVIRRYMRFMQYFSANFLYGHKFYSKLKTAPDMATALVYTKEFFEAEPKINALPNINSFI